MKARASTSNPPSSVTKFFVPPSDPPRPRPFASSPIRTFRDGLPPTKRRRLESTPTSCSSPPLTPRSSSSRPEHPPPADLHSARTASVARVLNIWSSLAERYKRRLDEDDVVNILTGQVIEDRGVLSDLPKSCKFGDLADKGEVDETDRGGEMVDNPAEADVDGNDEDEDDIAFPSTSGLLTSKLAQVTQFKHPTASSDAEDLREFLEAEAIRRELDGDDDDSSSEDELNLLPPRLTPAKRTRTPARKKVAQPHFLPHNAPNTDTESEDEFAVGELDQDDVHSVYRALNTPSPEIPVSIPSPPPLSSSPEPSSLFSYPSSPPASSTPSKSNSDPPTGERIGSPTPRRHPVPSTSRKTLEEVLDEVDLEFPPPPPRAPPLFARPKNPPFITDLSLSDDETEDERPEFKPPVNVAANVLSEPRTVEQTSPAPVPRKWIPYVLIETKARTPKPTWPTRSTKLPKPSSDVKGDDRDSPSSPPSPSPPPTRPWTRRGLKRKRIVSSDSDSSGDQAIR